MSEKIAYIINEPSCPYCSKESSIKAIATGHDHTDYSVYTCTCKGAKKHGEYWGSDEIKWRRE